MDPKDYYVGEKKNGLEIRILKMHEIQDGQMKRHELGNSNDLSIFKLIVVGETGSGKTTFINSLVNNIFGVDYYDKFRYSICKLNNMSRSESESQTDFVTEYTFNYIKGMKRKCNFVIVDTPGLEDTRGVDIQNTNIQQIHEYISEHPSQIGFTIHSSTNRLAAKQKSVLLELKDMIKSGKICDIIILSTFADSDSPSVKNVLDGFDIPYSNLFLFNNNALFSRNKDIPNNDLKSFKMNWEASNRSMNNLLDFMWTDVKAHLARNIGQNESKKLSTSNKIYICDTAMAKEDKQVPDAMNMKPELVENVTKTNTIASENASNKADELASVEEQMSTSESSATSSPRVQEDNPITSKDPDATNLRKDLVENVTKTNTIASENASNKDDGIASVNDQMPTSESSATSPPKVQKDNPISPEPDGWTELLSENGTPYYFHAQSERTQWDKPTSTCIPDGWTELLSENGTPYYFHAQSERTQWDKPTSTCIITLPPDKTSKNIQDDTEATQSQAYGQWHLRSPTEASHDQQRGQGFPANTPLYPAAQMSHYPTHPTKEPSVVHATGITSTLLSERPMPPSRHENPSYMSGPDQAGGRWHPHRQTEASHDQQRGQGFPSNSPVYPAAQMPQSRHPTKEPSVVPETGITSTPSSERPMPPSRHVNPSNMSGPVDPQHQDQGFNANQSLSSAAQMSQYPTHPTNDPSRLSETRITSTPPSDTPMTPSRLENPHNIHGPAAGDNSRLSSHNGNLVIPTNESLHRQVPSDRKYEKMEQNDETYYSSILKDFSFEDITCYKFGMVDILTVSRISMYEFKPETIKEKILFVISKIIMLDCSPVNRLLFTMKSDKETEDTSYSDSDSDSDESIVEEDDKLHPSDVYVIIMNCCDNILKQVLIQKMMTCQAAIPLIIPNLLKNEHIFHLWALRQLSFKWISQKNGPQEENPINYPIPIISAIRLGKLSKSKSIILNGIISKEAHDIFFHRDLQGGSIFRKLSNGVLELAWYLPGRGKDESFNDIWTVANLRGDALDYSTQLDFLNRVSSIMLVFLTEEILCTSFSILEKLSRSDQQIIFVYLDEGSPFPDKKKVKDAKRELKKLLKNKTYMSIKGSKKNKATIIDEITDKIQEALQVLQTDSNKQIFTLKKVSSVAENIGINIDGNRYDSYQDKKVIDIDENSENCLKGMELANIIVEILKSDKAEERKEKVLPLRGELWSKWGKLSKQIARMEGVEGEDPALFNARKGKEKQKCREEQFILVKGMKPVMKKFIQNISTTKNSMEVIIYFLQWMKFFLDDESSKWLPNLQKDYHEYWTEFQKKETKSLSDSKLLKEKEKILDDTSFGLEHFMREIGQIFEATQGNRKKLPLKDLIMNLPNSVADLLIAGFPLEIMDGDACHMPMTWLKAVFNSLAHKLPSKRVYVISVLGIQSSGKSTLLNTMFGLNFTVAAGRCTKGVFAQLISVDLNISAELGYEYILVLDTEGLRAPELANIKLSHDNEIATLVIAMGDVTIVNLKGENASEMEEILQICVHAFLRMRLAINNVTLQPGCYFAHQNVADVTASSKMQFSNTKILEKLNEITSAAAEHESVDSIQNFKDVIDFDVNKQIFYFPNLWKGNPPMAPANIFYSEKAFDLKKDLLFYPSIGKRKNCLTFTQLQIQMNHLWSAILKENFVFSFRNSLEIKSFAGVEKKTLSICIDFRDKANHECSLYRHNIDNCEEIKISNYQQELITKVKIFIENHHSKLKKELEDFFSSSPDKAIIEQWKFSEQKKLENLKDELLSEAKNDFNNRFEICKTKHNQKKEIDKYKKDIEGFVKKLESKHFENVTTPKRLKEMFEEEWRKWMNTLGLIPVKSKKDVSGDIRRVFVEVYHQHYTLLDEYNQRKRVPDIHTLPTIDEKDITLKQPHHSSKNKVNHTSKKTPNEFKWLNPSTWFNSKENKHTQIEIRDFTKTIMEKVAKYLDTIKEQDYETKYTYKIQGIFADMIDKFSALNRSYKLSIVYEVKVFSHILNFVTPILEEMHRSYLERNSPKNILTEQYKPQALEVFMSSYEQCKKETTAAKILKNFWLKAINASLKERIADEINKKLSSKPEFQTKKGLIGMVLMDLRKENSFEKYLNYIKNGQESLESWIEEYVTKYCMTPSQGKSMLGTEANRIFEEIVMQLIVCVKTASGNPTIKFHEWIEKFNNAAKEIINLFDTSFNIFDIEGLEAKDIKFFEKEIIRMLKDLITNEKEALDNWDMEVFSSVSSKPYKVISQRILGCMKQCPLCKVICSNTQAHDDDVKHWSPLHYPQGMKGFFKESSQELVISHCNISVASDRTFSNSYTDMKSVKYKKYQSVNDYYASWRITDDTSFENSGYWSSVFAKFSQDFAQHYGRKCNNIPSEWNEIKDDDVEKCISKMFD